MRVGKIIFATLTASALLAASVSGAEARGWRHHGGPGPVLGLLGGIIVGAATIATLPLVIVADAVRPGPSDRGYDDRDERGPPPNSYGYNRGGYGRGDYDDAPPPPPPPPRYRDYGPPRGYYGY